MTLDGLTDDQLAGMHAMAASRARDMYQKVIDLTHDMSACESVSDSKYALLTLTAYVAGAAADEMRELADDIAAETARRRAAGAGQ